MQNDLRNVIARLDRLKPPTGGNVIDLERVRLQREMRAAQALMTEDEREDFARGLISAMVIRMRFRGRVDDCAADSCEGEP